MRGGCGYEPDDPVELVCPVCGADCRQYYRNLDGEILGCEECVETVDAEDYIAEVREAHEIEKGCHWNE